MEKTSSIYAAAGNKKKTNLRRVALCIILAAGICICSILIFKALAMHSRYKYCFLDDAFVETWQSSESVAHTEGLNDYTIYYYETGSYVTVYNDNRTVLFYISGSDHFRQYENGELKFISVGMFHKNRHTYKTYPVI